MGTAAIYARQSFDRHDDELAVTRQLDLCRKFAAEQGWEVVGEYVDNDRSATSGKERPQFEALLAASPERIVVWHTDRLVRLTRDLERVIGLGVNVHALKAGHLDLSHPAGRATARTVTAWAQYETEQKAERQRASNDQRAASGLPYKGQRAFGYEPDGMTIREPEAAALRAAADGVVRGLSLSALCRDLNERGLLTATGKTWRNTTLKAALLSPRNAGYRRHRGEVVGKAAWPAILDEDTAAAVKAILTDPSRSRRGPNRRYLLSGVLTCGKCHGPVVGTYIKEANKGTKYRCTGHVSRSVDPVDDYITGLVVGRLSQPDAINLFTRPGLDDAAVAELRDEQATLRTRADGLAEAFAMGDISREQLTAGTKRLAVRQEEVDAALAATVTDPTLSEVVRSDDVAAAFAALPMEARRELVRALMEIEVLPVGPGRRNVPPTESVRVVWRQS